MGDKIPICCFTFENILGVILCKQYEHHEWSGWLINHYHPEPEGKSTAKMFFEMGSFMKIVPPGIKHIAQMCTSHDGYLQWWDIPADNIFGKRIVVGAYNKRWLQSGANLCGLYIKYVMSKGKICEDKTAGHGADIFWEYITKLPLHDADNWIPGAIWCITSYASVDVHPLSQATFLSHATLIVFIATTTVQCHKQHVCHQQHPL